MRSTVEADTDALTVSVTPHYRVRDTSCDICVAVLLQKMDAALFEDFGRFFLRLLDKAPACYKGDSSSQINAHVVFLDNCAAEKQGMNKAFNSLT